MPCLNCNTQFTIFKRKRSCSSCHCFYCSNCLAKTRKTVFHCVKCSKVIEFAKNSREQLLQLKTKDLVFFLQSRKINIAGIVEKEELCNLIINHLNNNLYYEGSTTSSASTPNDFDNYAQSFDQIKQTCQSLFTSITDKIAIDLQKTTCFNQSSGNNNNPRRNPQNPPQFSNGSANEVQQQQPSSSDLSHNQVDQPSIIHNRTRNADDCECSDNEDYDEGKISEKRESIFQANTSHAKKRTKLNNSASKGSDSSFEEVFDEWLLVQKSNEVEIPSPQTSVQNQPLPSTSSGGSHAQKVINRRRSDSDLNRISVDLSSHNPSQNIKVSCRKCGRAKSKIKHEILKLTEQLKSSSYSEDEINSKIKEFINYLESMRKHDSTEVTEESQADITNSASHHDIEEIVLEENEGINVYASTSNSEANSFGTSQRDETPKRFISLNDIGTTDELEAMSVKQLKEVLMLNRVDFRGCCEKNELKERVKRLWESHKAAPPPEQINSDDLCKICMDAPIECVFLECGHSIGCTACGKILSECPICRSYIVRVVRIFKS